LLQTLTALRDHLRYDGPLHVVVADDGSTDATASVVASADATLVVTDRGGLGANTNAGLRVAFDRADFVLQLQDDMALQMPLNLTPHVQRLRDYGDDGFIRLWGVGGHRYTATLDGAYWRIF
jgi:glycosyltransferase involved in cell wall biosynthesis